MLGVGQSPPVERHRGARPWMRIDAGRQVDPVAVAKFTLRGLKAPAVPRSEERRVGKECVVRVDLGGRRIINNKTSEHSKLLQQPQPHLYGAYYVTTMNNAKIRKDQKK